MTLLLLMALHRLEIHESTVSEAYDPDEAVDRDRSWTTNDIVLRTVKSESLSHGAVDINVNYQINVASYSASNFWIVGESHSHLDCLSLHAVETTGSDDVLQCSIVGTMKADRNISRIFN